MNKTLSEYVGVCWHEVANRIYGTFTHPCIHCDDLLLSETPTNPDFTTPDGWQLIADKISERGEWDDFALWLIENVEGFTHMEINTAECFFHRTKQPADKSKLVYEALTAGAIGGKS